ncbi:MAG: HAD-IA family hydrolase [Nitrospinota bacterium]|nr:HAD-IA family hydrolase [Nitrospinota bacterium]
MKRFKTVVFDLDGTLTNTLPVIFDAFNHVISPYSNRIHSNEEISSYFGPSEENIIANFVPSHEVGQALTNLHSYYVGNSHRVTLFEGIREIIDLISSRNLSLFLFTGKGRHGTTITLKQLGLDNTFGAIVTGDDVIRAKPDGEGMLKLLEDTGTSAEETIFIGDTEADIMAGDAAGVATALALWGGTIDKDDLSSKPDYILGAPNELEELLI